jgi:hypothetical protein
LLQLFYATADVYSVRKSDHLVPTQGLHLDCLLIAFVDYSDFVMRLHPIGIPQIHDVGFSKIEQRKGQIFLRGATAQVLGKDEIIHSL